MKNIIKGKRADISITLLVVMTLALCGAAILTFLYADYSQTKQALVANNFAEFYANDSAFELFVCNAVEDTLDVMLKNLRPEEITSEDFINRFQANYDGYSLEGNFPEDFKNEDIARQIKDSSNYDVQAGTETLKFRLKNFNFTRSYDYKKSSGLSSISLTKDLACELLIIELTK